MLDDMRLVMVAGKLLKAKGNKEVAVVGDVAIEVVKEDCKEGKD
jgi:hypothetical protein